MQTIVLLVALVIVAVVKADEKCCTQVRYILSRPEMAINCSRSAAMCVPLCSLNSLINSFSTNPVDTYAPIK